MNSETVVRIGEVIRALCIASALVGWNYLLAQYTRDAIKAERWREAAFWVLAAVTAAYLAISHG